MLNVLYMYSIEMQRLISFSVIIGMPSLIQHIPVSNKNGKINRPDLLLDKLATHIQQLQYMGGVTGRPKTLRPLTNLLGTLVP